MIMVIYIISYNVIKVCLFVITFMGMGFLESKSILFVWSIILLAIAGFLLCFGRANCSCLSVLISCVVMTSILVVPPLTLPYPSQSPTNRQLPSTPPKSSKN